MVLSRSNYLRSCTRAKGTMTEDDTSAKSGYYSGLDFEAKKRCDVKITTLAIMSDPYTKKKTSNG